MADAVLKARGIDIVMESINGIDKVRVPVAGNTEIAIGELISLSSGKGIAFTTAANATDTDNFVGGAITGQDGSDGSGDTNYITVAKRFVARVTFASAPAASIYIGAGVAVTTAASHVYTFENETSGVSQCAWMYETGDASRVDLLVYFDTPLTSHGAQTAGTGFWHANAAE